ncbi:hypothetical protein DERP_014821 [Dermatophagoides pteronyssinus]|uniref:Uncharacterized protein n=1 Tax=Dermatophagoides pteronyssinus TaxID=6956 RepID=A0ABQ8J2X6_DERPT|nr:hypothetical protein DERP_014821 [Dermatophagoides pteronyssinus]
MMTVDYDLQTIVVSNILFYSKHYHVHRKNPLRLFNLVVDLLIRKLLLFKRLLSSTVIIMIIKTKQRLVISNKRRNCTEKKCYRNIPLANLVSRRPTDRFDFTATVVVVGSSLFELR